MAEHAAFQSAVIHHHHHFRLLLLSVDMRKLIYMSRQYRPTYNEKYTKHKTQNTGDS